MELVRRGQRASREDLIARPMHAYTTDYVVSVIGENLKHLQEIDSNLDIIDYGEMIHARDGSKGGIATFTGRSIESLKEFLADICTWDGGVPQFLGTRPVKLPSKFPKTP